MTIKAIETRYAGWWFRSRLEARWAVSLDALGIRWEYEAQGYELPSSLRYLPDFWLPDQQVHLEVKGHEDAFLAEAPRYAEAIQTSSLPGYELIILGPIPDPDRTHWPYAIARHPDDVGHNALCIHMVDLGTINEAESSACRVGGERPNSFATYCREIPSYTNELPPISGYSNSWPRQKAHNWVDGKFWRHWHSLDGTFRDDVYERSLPRQRGAYTAARSARFEHGAA